MDVSHTHIYIHTSWAKSAAFHTRLMIKYEISNLVLTTKTIRSLIDPFVIETENLVSSRHVAMAMKLFLDNAIALGNHHTKYEIHLF